MKIGYLGSGSWGFCLARLLAKKSYEVVVWAQDPKLVEALNRGDDHPNLPGFHIEGKMRLTTDLGEALAGIDMLCEGVTSAGIRPVFEEVKSIGMPHCPIVLTSKGIEQGTGLLLSDVVCEVLGDDARRWVGCLSGPSLAAEVIKELPTSVVCSGYTPEVIRSIKETFSTETFRVYPNSDIDGVEFGGAMKNIMAIACGMSDGMGFGDDTKAALMTRGLHEIRKLAAKKGCRPETLNGLAGMGDLCVTCLSVLSRNYRFGNLLAKGRTPEQAQKEIGMVVEGAYTCVSALELARSLGLELPITQVVHKIIYEGLSPRGAVKLLLSRETKEEHL